jgi:hypothetical protein
MIRFYYVNNQIIAIIIILVYIYTNTFSQHFAMIIILINLVYIYTNAFA